MKKLRLSKRMFVCMGFQYIDECMYVGKTDLVSVAEEYAHAMGMADTPAIPNKVLKKMGLYVRPYIHTVHACDVLHSYRLIYNALSIASKNVPGLKASADLPRTPRNAPKKVDITSHTLRTYIHIHTHSNIDSDIHTYMHLMRALILTYIILQKGPGSGPGFAGSHPVQKKAYQQKQRMDKR